MAGLNPDSFSHGQVKSKMWLCEKLEPHVKDNSKVAILGGWVNLLGFMMLTRQPKKYEHIKSIDIDSESIDLADQINSYWIIERILRNEIADANTFNTQGFDVVINCSAEHMENTTWFDRISPGTLVCIQSTNVIDIGDPWFVKTPSPTMDYFIKKYPLTDVKFTGILPIRYNNWGYDRFMLIGIK